MERLEALQRVNADLGKKLGEAERTLQVISESELEEMEARRLCHVSMSGTLV